MSVEAIHVRLICVCEIVLPRRPVGVDGAWVSPVGGGGAGSVVAEADAGSAAEKIGLILRDEHGFQKNKTPIKISEILKKHNLYIQPDIQNLQKKIGIIKDHMKKNKGDVRGKRDLVRLESNLNRNKKYFS